MSCQLARAQTKKGLHFFAHSSRQTQNFTGKEKNQDFRTLLPLLGKKFRNLPSSLWLDPSPLYPAFPPNLLPTDPGGGAGLAERAEMAALATLVKVATDAPIQGWPWGRRDTCAYGPSLEPHPGPCGPAQQPSMAQSQEKAKAPGWGPRAQYCDL